jgi:hypothetical protein
MRLLTASTNRAKIGYAESTIGAAVHRLNQLKRKCDLNDPESVKGYIANKTCSNGFKETLVETYDFLIRSTGGKWDKPFYERYNKLPRIPSEERINMLISNSSQRMALILSMMRDMGTRPIEQFVNLPNG